MGEVTGSEVWWRRHLPDVVGDAWPDLLAEGSLPAAWARRWRESPDALTIHDGDQGWLTAGQLGERSRTVAGRLAGQGLVSGDHVLISATSSADLVIAHVACLRAGFVVVPANTAYRSGELGHIVRDAAPKAAIVDDAERAGWIRDASDESIVICTPEVDLPDSSPPPLDHGDPTASGLIAYTSGTTGAPKGAVLSHGNLLAGAETLRLAWRWTADDRLVLCLPLFHLHGLGAGLHGTLLVGGSAVLQSGFDPDAVLDAVDQHGATLFFGVPTMYARFAQSARVGELAALRLCVSGSAPLPADLHRTLEAGCSQRVLERYGMTETLLTVSNPHDGERRAGSVGFPLPGVELRLDAQLGEIEVCGPSVFSGYLNRPEENADAFTTDGWLRTGDLGEIDDDGYVVIVGRAKELVISGGYNVYPREVEDALREHPAVRDAAVCGTPDDEWGEIVTAFLEIDQPVTADELTVFLTDRLAGYKRPRRIEFTDALPRNALGKVQKHRLEDG